jgi:small-conductance mechanosensitive channel
MLRLLLTGLLLSAVFAAAVPPARVQAQGIRAVLEKAVSPDRSSEGEAADTTANPDPPARPVSIAPATVDPADQALLDGWKIKLDQIARSLEAKDISDSSLVDLRRTVIEIRDQIKPLVARLQPRADTLNARLEELSLPKEQSALEPATLKLERESQTRLLVALEAILKQAQSIRLRADELISTIEERRRQLFAAEIGERRSSILDPSLWRDIVSELPRAIVSLNLLVEDWTALLRDRAGGVSAAGGLLVFLVVIVVVGPVRRYLDRRTNRDPTATNVAPLPKVTHAVAIASVNVGIVVVLLGGLIILLDAFDLSPSRIDDTLLALLQSLGLFATVRGLSQAIIAPVRPSWRYLTVADGAAVNINKWVVLYAGIFAAGLFVVRMSDVLALPLPVIEGLQGIFAVATAAASMGTLHAVARGLNEDSDSPDGGTIAIWRWLLPPAWLTAIVAALAPLAGYLTLGWFLVGQAAWVGVVLSILFLALVMADEVISAAFRTGTTIGDILLRNLRLRPATIEQIGAILSGVARIFLIAIAASLVLAPFGLNGDDLSGAIRRTLTGLSIGSVTISPGAIVAALAVFAVGMLATRAFQRWLDTRFLPHTRMDVGLKTSVRTGLGYLGVIVAGMVAFSVAGFNLQNVAIIAGALSVGVGFGLQSIVNNFVSGLILLAERPIKAGDWIVVGADQGYVKRINVRSTEIETFDRSTVIVPNSDLISGVVKNWMHNDNSGRVIVDVRVPFQSDPDEVHDLLLEVAQAHPNVLAYPEAKVYLSDFGESALEFQLFCYLGNVDYMLSAKSELRFAVFRALRKNGIEIPYTRRDVHIADRASDRPAPLGAPHQPEPPSREAISDAPDGDGAEI